MNLLDATGTSYDGIFAFLNQKTGSLRFLGCKVMDEVTGSFQIDLLCETAESFINVNCSIRLLFLNEELIPGQKNVFFETQVGVGLKLYQFRVDGDSGSFEVLYHLPYGQNLSSPCGMQFPFFCGFDQFHPDDKDEFVRIFYIRNRPHLLFYRHKTQQVYALSFEKNEGEFFHKLAMISDEDFANPDELREALFPVSQSGTTGILFLNPKNKSARLGKLFSDNEFMKIRDVPVNLSQDKSVLWEDFFQNSVACFSHNHMRPSGTLQENHDEERENFSFQNFLCSQTADENSLAPYEVDLQKINVVFVDGYCHLVKEKSQSKIVKPQLQMNRGYYVRGLQLALIGMDVYHFAVTFMDPDAKRSERMLAVGALKRSLLLSIALEGMYQQHRRREITETLELPVRQLTDEQLQTIGWTRSSPITIPEPASGAHYTFCPMALQRGFVEVIRNLNNGTHIITDDELNSILQFIRNSVDDAERVKTTMQLPMPELLKLALDLPGPVECQVVVVSSKFERNEELDKLIKGERGIAALTEKLTIFFDKNFSELQETYIVNKLA